MKEITKNNINKLFLYRSFIYIFTKFYTKDKDYIGVVNALNIKNKYKRIEYIYNNTCNYLDNYYSKFNNVCKFKNNKCVCHRNKEYINGCCRKCIYQSTTGCTTKNLTCKLFYCSKVKDKYKVYTFNDLPILKVLDLRRQEILKIDYFTNTKDAILDLKIGLYIIVLLKIFLRNIINLYIKNTNKLN